MIAQSVPCVGDDTPYNMLENKEICGLPVYMFPLQETNRLGEDTRQQMFAPWSPALPTPSTVTPHTPLVPNSLARAPHTWSKEEVRVWLEWCGKEWAVEPVSQDKFDMNGKALGLLNRADFLERDPSSGDLLFNALQRLINKHDISTHCSYPSHPHIGPPPGGVPSYPHHSPPCLPIKPTPVHDARQNGIILFTGSSHSQPTYTSDKHQPSYVPIRPVPVTSYPSAIQQKDLSPKVPDSMLSPAPTTDTDSGAETELLAEGEDDMMYTEDDKHHQHSPETRMSRDITDQCLAPVKRSEGDCRLLWEFIHQLLQESRYREFVTWERQEELIFRIVNPTGLAELWGYQKNRTNMTYEKLSRALRYYYKMNIIKKVSGKRLTYQFLQHPRNIKKGQRGARPHSARLTKDSNEPISADHLKEANKSPIRDPQTEEHKPIISHNSLHPHDPQPIRSPSSDPYGKDCDLQFIDGHLRPLPMDDEHSPEIHPLPYLKQEIPVQEEPEDLSMKTVRRQFSENDSSDSSDKHIDVVDIKTESLR